MNPIGPATAVKVDNLESIHTDTWPHRIHSEEPAMVAE